MNTNFIEVAELHEAKLLEVVQEFVNLYAKDENPYALKCTVYRYENRFVVSGLDGYDLFSFCYLTNFIKYPIETHFLGQEPVVTGHMPQGHPRFPGTKSLQVYNTGTIEEPDAVIISTYENEHFFFDFGDRVTPCKTELPARTDLQLNPASLVKIKDIHP